MIRRDCGSCNLCCTLLGVPDIGKPIGMTCWWTTVHGGCSRQSEKPDPAKVGYDEETGTFSLTESESGKDLSLLSCAQFECLWLQSQRHPDESKVLSRMLRPDISHVVMGPVDKENENLLYVHVDPDHKSSWKEGFIFEYLQGILSRGGEISLSIGDSKIEMEIET